MSTKGSVVSQPTRLSQSNLFEIQKNYFAHKGVSAWDSDVPYFISSNAFISTRTAHMVIQYLREVCVSGDSVTIVELGAGHGKFSFYFINALEKSLLAHDQFSYQYIVTDSAQKNIDFCQQNESFQNLVAEKKLDFGVFDLMHEDDFLLLNQKKSFSESCGNVVVFIANYVFDVLPQDGFMLENNTLHEMQVGLKSRYKRFDKEKPERLHDLELDYTFQSIESKPYYGREHWDHLLEGYSQHLSEGNGVFLFPVSAFHFIERMKQKCNSFLLVCGDKGVATPEQVKNLKLPSVHSYDGCYAYMFNFHALGDLMKREGGDYLPTSHNNSYKICLYSHGRSFASLPRTVDYFENELEVMGADEFCYLNDDYAYNNYRYPIKTCLSFLRMSYYEPDTYFHMHDRIMDSLKEINTSFGQELKSALEKVETNLYHYKSFYDVFSLLGMFYMELKLYDKSEALFRSAMKYGKNRFVPLRGLGFLFQKRGNSSQALKYFKQAYKLNPEDKVCLESIRRIEGSPILLLKPLARLVFVSSVAIALIYLALFRV